MARNPRRLVVLVPLLTAVKLPVPAVMLAVSPWWFEGLGLHSLWLKKSAATRG